VVGRCPWSRDRHNVCTSWDQPVWNCESGTLIILRVRQRLLGQREIGGVVTGEDERVAIQLACWKVLLPPHPGAASLRPVSDGDSHGLPRLVRGRAGYKQQRRRAELVVQREIVQAA
jgi:hypothetical protein